MHRLRLCLLISATFPLGLVVQPATAGPAAETAPVERVLVEPPRAFLEACQRYAWLCEDRSASVRPTAPEQALELARRINRRVNDEIAQLSDAENYGVADYWTLPRNGRGDCEDFVLEKYSRLVAAGIDGRILSLAIVLDRRGDNHAVLVLHDPSGDLVLDSLSSRIVPWNQTGYTFLAMQTSGDKSVWELVAHRPIESNLLAQR